MFDETGRSFQSGISNAKWMVENREFFSNYGDAAYALLPSKDIEFFDQFGYRLQLRTGLRQRKSPMEMYTDLLYASGERDFYAALELRDEAIEQGHEEKAKAWFRQQVAALEVSNPVWGAKKNERRTPDYVARNVAPAVRKLAEASPGSLPSEIRKHQEEIRVLAKLYDEYQSARSRASSNGEKIGIASQYGRYGDSLFKDGPISDLWYRMRVWES
jgi:hypothetical protein